MGLGAIPHRSSRETLVSRDVFTAQTGLAYFDQAAVTANRKILCSCPSGLVNTGPIYKQ